MTDERRLMIEQVLGLEKISDPDMRGLAVEVKNEIIEQAKALSRVDNDVNRQIAADLWDAIRAFRKQAEAEKERVCRPLKTAWDEARQPFDAFIKECEGHERRLEEVMAAYDLELRRQAEEKQRKIVAKIEAQNQRALEKAAAKGVEPPPLKPIPVVTTPPASIKTQAGTVQTAKTVTVYSLAGVETDELVRANDARVAELLKTAPSVFVLDWPSFRTLAKSGALDGVAGVEKKEAIVYEQRKR